MTILGPKYLFCVNLKITTSVWPITKHFLSTEEMDEMYNIIGKKYYNLIKLTVKIGVMSRMNLRKWMWGLRKVLPLKVEVLQNFWYWTCHWVVLHNWLSSYWLPLIPCLHGQIYKISSGPLHQFATGSDSFRMRLWVWETQSHIVHFKWNILVIHFASDHLGFVFQCFLQSLVWNWRTWKQR